jgi:hypothetical protein
MASLFKPTYTVKDPKTGKKVRRKAKKWYGQYMDLEGVLRRVPLSENKTVAQQMLTELVRKAEMAKVNLTDPFEEYRVRPLLCPVCQSKGKAEDGSTCGCPCGAHLTDYRRSLEAKEKDPRYVSQVVSHCVAIFTGTGARFIQDLDANEVEHWLAEQRRDRLGTKELRTAESGCEELRAGWVRGLEPPTFRSTV